MMIRLKKVLKKIKKEIEVYRSVLKDPRTPLISKILLWIAIGYLLLPFDLIPDWIPVLGQVDDIIVVPSCVMLAMLFVPKEVILHHRTISDVI